MGTRSAPLDRSVARTMRRQTEAQVRTDINHVVTQAREAFYGENDDLIAGVIWVSTLDGGTTPICRSLDGKFFEIGKGQRPPAHYNCRSTTAPVTKSLKELGIGADDTRGLPDGVRASMGGDVPAKTTYYDWLSGQSTAVQNEVLGPKRAALWRDGRVKAEDFTDDRGRLLTLDELERKLKR
jgi:SPP1 gp7 family putative phage head morphogenesis protein